MSSLRLGSFCDALPGNITDGCDDDDSGGDEDCELQRRAGRFFLK